MGQPNDGAGQVDKRQQRLDTTPVDSEKKPSPTSADQLAEAQDGFREQLGEVAQSPIDSDLDYDTLMMEDDDIDHLAM